MNALRHWIAKIYLLQQIPLSGQQIQAGVNSVDLWLCSTGGAGSNLLKDHIQKYKTVKSPYMEALLTHHSTPIPCEKPGYKAVYLHANPIDVLKSTKNRKLLPSNVKKLNNTKDIAITDENLLIALFNQFNNWTKPQTNYPILCLKYEALYQHLDALADFLNIPFDSFPAHQERKSAEVVIDPLLIEKFETQLMQWQSWSDIQIIYPKK